ncbi:MAG TPA: hypothetical protein ENJ80_10135 [Gammaproteobacteria bacterium]|nr:hypothetical protein [Gammaproteobacteria bacterium]
MAAAALYILTGITLYASGHHLLLRNSARGTEQPHLWLAGMYLLLSGFALASAMTYQAHSPVALLSAGRFAITLGIVLWGTLIWFVARRSAYRPLLWLDVLSAAWIALLIKNSIATNSLLYADGSIAGQPAISPWWNALEVTLLASLVYTLYASYRMFMAGQRAAALTLGGGLGLLALTAVFDHLVNTGVTRSIYLAPFGFMGFLLVNSLYPQLVAWLDRRRAGGLPPVVYNLTYSPERATFHSDVSDLRIPLPEEDAVAAAPQENNAPVHNNQELRDKAPVESPQAMEPDIEPVTDSDTAQDAPAHTTTAEEPERKIPVMDQETLNIISDNLIDIAVYATMANNRFKRGDADPRVLEMLCKKVRTQAIKTRRLVSKLSDP